EEIKFNNINNYSPRENFLLEGKEYRDLQKEQELMMEVKSLKLTHKLTSHKGLVYSLAVLPDGNIISASDDKTLKIWDVYDYTCIRTLEGHNGCVYTVIILPDGKLASGSFDKTIRLWTSCSEKNRPNLI